MTTPDDKYISEFHQQYLDAKVDPLQGDNLALYVDYSTCMAMGQSSPFFNALVPSFVNATKKYYSIKGSDIIEEQGQTFQLLRTIQEVNYADLRTAIDKMAEGNGESALLTDGEYYQQNIARGNINNPYMADAFKKWLMRGHDIFVISEPYAEFSGGNQYAKKRFYILFTDVRLAGNIYDRIVQTSQLQNFPDVELFHLSADHPSLLSTGGEHSEVNPLLGAKVKGYGNYEIQDWPLSWKDGIEPLIVGGVNQQTGAPLPNGDYIAKGIKVDRNSLGAFRIEEVTAKIYDINEAYANFYEAKETRTKPTSCAEVEVSNFIKIDDKEFKSHGTVALYFDTQMYDPSWMNASPYNYIKIDLCVSKVIPIFNQYANMFQFESIDVPGEVNTSVAESIKQCMADPNIQNKVKEQPIYSIYIKSPER